MKTLSEIEQAIKELPTKEARQLAGWLNKYLEDTSFLASRKARDVRDDAWDRQMQTDLSTGKLDKFIAKAESDIEANQVRDLDEVFDREGCFRSESISNRGVDNA